MEGPSVITRIEAYNYRCFENLAADLSRFHVLAGANGSGKSTLLDIPVLLGELLSARRVEDVFLDPSPATGRPPRALSLRELTHRGGPGGFGFAVEARLPGPVAELIAESSRDPRFPAPTHVRYELHLEPVDDGRGLEITGEYLVLFHEDTPVRPIPDTQALGDPDEATVTGRGRNQRITPQWHEPWRPVVARTRGPVVRFTPEAGRQGEQLNLRSQPSTVALATVPFDDTQFPAALWLQSLLRDGTVLYAPEWGALRQAAPPAGRDPGLDTEGFHVPWLALRLRHEDPARYEAWVDLVQLALPQVEAVEVIEREEDRHAYFRVTYTGGYEVTSSGLSDGTLRVLAYTLLPYLSRTPALLVTEEPENGIYPQAIEIVMQALRSVRGSQVLVASQSPLVLAQADLADVLATRMDPATGAVTVVRGDHHPRMADWRAGLDDLDLGTLFATGVFE
ncbi:AAA family ATPase [Streptomyces sp. ICN988]|uniref:methylation-associated defense system AAA family ATPase MAD3 n=1 Tax=Streptomyces sp. ICN988 TaxID=2983765 RepID=UPI0021E37570|nr:AAA family ATPase [Streptomyces sp. ICN988]MCV2459429.1 AAA family ATPase [Streptomyces sp. ICN988]